MPRAAGNKNYYEFVLRRSNGRYDKETVIELPSVTHVIKSTLAAPQLVRWAYQQTVDSVTGLVSTSPAFDREALTDADMLSEWLKQNRMRPEDVASERGDEGKVAHAFLESLVTLSQESELTAMRVAQRRLNMGDPYQTAVALWWVETQPRVVESEAILYSLRHRFAGTCDLVTEVPATGFRITDLKTRRAGLPMYTSDDVQTGGYSVAYSEMYNTPIFDRQVVIAYDDGTYRVCTAETDEQVFLDLLSVYRGIRMEVKIHGQAIR